MRRSRLAALMALAVSAGGCEFDLTPVEVIAPARLTIQLRVIGPGGPLDVTAFFHPGAVSGGHVRPLVDDSLRVDGVAIAPVQVEASGTRVYHISGLPPSTTSLSFVPPRVVGVSEEPPEVTVHRVAIVAVDTIVAPRVGMIEIRISGLDRLPSEGVTGSWHVEVHADSCDSADLLTVFSHAAPPPVIEIAANLLPGELQFGYLDAAGHVRQEIGSFSGSYEIFVASAYRACIPFRITG